MDKSYLWAVNTRVGRQMLSARAEAPTSTVHGGNGMIEPRVKWLLLLVVALVVPTAGEAQISGRMGVSVGTLHQNCTNCTSGGLSPFGRLALEGQIGVQVSGKARLGLEGAWWQGEYLGLKRRFLMLSVAGQWSPSRQTPLYFDGAVGYAMFRDQAGGSTLEASGVAFQAGVGFPIRMAGEVSLVPFVRYLRTTTMGTEVDGNVASARIQPHMIRLGLAIQWR